MDHEKAERRLAQPVADILAQLVMMPPGTPVTFASHCPGLSNAKTMEEAWTSLHVCEDHCEYFWCGPHAIYIGYINKIAGDFSGSYEIGEGSNKTTWYGMPIGSERNIEIWEAIYGPRRTKNSYPPYQFEIVAMVQCDGPPLVRPYAALSKNEDPEWIVWKQYAKKAAEAVYRHRALHGVIRGCRECSQ